MPLTDEQKAAVETLKGVASEDIEEATEALKTTAHPIYQKIFGGGHSAATQKAKTEKAALDAQLTEAKEREAALETELTELKAKTPDRAQIDTQWQAKLDREVKKVQDQLDAASQQVARLTTDTTVEKAENALKDAGLRPRMAKLLAKEAAGRIKWEDGKPVLYEAGTDIPIPIPADKTAFQVLAESEAKSADPEDLVSRTEPGGGIKGGGQGGEYDPVAAGKAAAEAQKKQAAANAVAFT